jgi:hypothetical protein
MPKKWREKDKQMLYQRIRERYLQLIKLRINLINVEPLRKLQIKQQRLSKRKDVEQRAQEKKRNLKLQQKQRDEAKAMAGKTGLRTLRTRQSGAGEENTDSMKMVDAGEAAYERSVHEKEDLSELERTIQEEANNS